MELIRDATLYKKDGSSHSPEELDNHQIFGFFFSNTLDNPTEKLLKVLKNFYEILRKNNKDMAIVLVSTEVNANPLRIDRTLEYLHDDWYALAPGDVIGTDLKNELLVYKNPQLIITTRSGRIITPEGDLSVTQADPLYVYRIWETWIENAINLPFTDFRDPKYPTYQRRSTSFTRRPTLEQGNLPKVAPDTAVARSTILSDEKVAEKISLDADTAAKNSKAMPKKASTRTQTKRRATTDDPVSHEQGDFPVIRKSYVPDFSNMRDLDSLKSKSMIVTRGGEAKLVSKDHNISPSSGKSVLEDRFTSAETALNKESLKPTDTSMSGATSEGTSLPTFREEKKSTSEYDVGGWKTKSSSVLQTEVDVTDNEERHGGLLGETVTSEFVTKTRPDESNMNEDKEVLRIRTFATSFLSKAGPHQETANFSKTWTQYPKWSTFPKETEEKKYDTVKFSEDNSDNSEYQTPWPKEKKHVVLGRSGVEIKDMSNEDIKTVQTEETFFCGSEDGNKEGPPVLPDGGVQYANEEVADEE